MNVHEWRAVHIHLDNIEAAVFAKTKQPCIAQAVEEEKGMC
jgi:hypothetical protein